MSVEHVIGKWDSLIGKEFYKPYMKELSAKIKQKKNNIFGGNFKSNKDMFHHFKMTDPNTIKAILITHNAKVSTDILFDIEHDLRGLDLNLTSNKDYDWLYEQGIMIFPMALSWEEERGRHLSNHEEWYKFTEQVLLDITSHRDDVLIVSALSSVNYMLEELRYFGCRKIYYGYGAWREIDKWCKEKYGVDIRWTP